MSVSILKWNQYRNSRHLTFRANARRILLSVLSISLGWFLPPVFHKNKIENGFPPFSSPKKNKTVKYYVTLRYVTTWSKITFNNYSIKLKWFGFGLIHFHASAHRNKNFFVVVVESSSIEIFTKTLVIFMPRSK